ncbi:carbonic anhydrase [Labilibaculum filiforme]|uniref:Carbonic anhydrase n=1 Tax=Labilibaculum filiforme TaxID=1940526 RepID=A0A2N3HUG1_9BACT|nr:carbonic anhydrase [Labilibaculum filiforme]PKQ61706.1 carbonic anhydrase [Labilibaculum filiforme]
MNQLLAINCIEDIIPEYRHTPIGLLLEYHNLGRPYATYSEAQLLVGMCMDNRKHLKIPENFSYIIRSGGANLRYSEFKVSYAISVGKVKHIALIGHDNCGMVNLHSRKDEFIRGLVGIAGWTTERAEEHFTNFAPMFEIGNAMEFVVMEAKRLRVKYPKITIAPLFYHVETNRLSIVKE